MPRVKMMENQKKNNSSSLTQNSKLGINILINKVIKKILEMINRKEEMFCIIYSTGNMTTVAQKYAKLAQSPSQRGAFIQNMFS